MIAATDKIVRFEVENELWFVNFSKADISQQGGQVTIHFDLTNDPDLVEEMGEGSMIGDEADLVFENIETNFVNYLNSLPRELNPPMHPTQGEWKYWALVEDGEVILFW